MTRGQAFPSKYMSKDDVPNPVSATIGDVRIEVLKGGEHGDENKAVIHFAGGSLKPMILNQGNWMTLEDKYGPDSDAWRGKPVEVFVDPSVMFGGKRVGGIRLRIPGGSINGSQPTQVWTLDTAVAESAKVGIDRAAVIAAVKNAGGSGWAPARDTPVVQALIAAAATKEQSFDEPATAEYGEQIPF